MLHKKFYIVIVLGLLLQSPAIAAGQRLDYSLSAEYPGAEAPTVVAGTIENLRPASGGDTTSNAGTPQTAEGIRADDFDFKIDQIILSPRRLSSKLIRVKSAITWPSSLIPLTEGSYCILILKPPSDEIWLNAAIPTLHRSFPALSDHIQVRNLISEELLNDISQEKSPQNQKDLILMVNTILTPDKAQSLVPLLNSSDTLVKKAAVSGLFYVTRDESYLKMIQEDINHLDQVTREDATVFFETYYFFVGSPTPVAAPDNKPFLQLDRFILTSPVANIPPKVRLGCLMNLVNNGTIEDVPLIFKIHQDIANVSFPIWDTYDGINWMNYRFEAVKGMSRLLDLKLNVTEATFYEREEQQIKRIYQEMIKLKLIEPASPVKTN